MLINIKDILLNESWLFVNINYFNNQVTYIQILRL